MSYNIKKILLCATKDLESCGIPCAALESKILLQKVLDCSREHLILNYDSNISREKYNLFIGLINRRKKLEPIAYITNNKEFYDLNFYVTKDVLIPRHDSEIIIDEVLHSFKIDEKINILDLGTGSGCLLLTLFKKFINSSGVAVDISKEALKIAEYNYKKLSLHNKVEFINASWNNIKISSKRKCGFDLIVSNPPYIKTQDIKDLQQDVKDYEPTLALDGGKNGFVCYKQIMPIINKMLNPSGIAILEFGINQADDLAFLIENHSLQIRKYLYDLSGIKRSVVIHNKNE